MFFHLHGFSRYNHIMANYKRIYADGYSYFITVTTHRRNPILIDTIDLLRESFRASKNVFDYRIDAIVIMPDHFHMIITPHESAIYPKIIGYIKAYFSKHCDPKYYADAHQSNSRSRSRYKPVWQKRYFEHTIRNEKDWNEKITYMQNNPVKHGLVASINDWPYSSFFTKKSSSA